MIPQVEFDAEGSIRQRRLQHNRSFFDHINDLLPTTFLLLVDIFLIIQLVINLNGQFRTLVSIGTFLIIVTILIISTIKEYHQLDLLEEIEIEGTKEEIKKYSKEIAESLHWSLIKENKDYLIYRNKWRVLSGGENITIIPTDNKLLVNSTSYPINDVTRTTLTFGANRKNILRFKKIDTKVEYLKGATQATT